MELSASNKHVEYEEECVLYNFDWSIIPPPPVGLRCVRFWRVGGAAEVKESLTANMGEGAGFSLASLAPCANGSVIYLVKCIFQEFLKFIVNATFVPGRVKSVTLSVVQRLKSVTCFVCGQIIVHTSSPASCSFLTWDLVHAQSRGKHFQEVKKSLFLDLSWSNVSNKSVIGHNFPRRIWVASFFLVSKAEQRTVNEGRSCAVIIVYNHQANPDLINLFCVVKQEHFLPEISNKPHLHLWLKVGLRQWSCLYCILLSSIVVYIAYAAPYPMTKVGWRQLSCRPNSIRGRLQRPRRTGAPSW